MVPGEMTIVSTTLFYADSNRDVDINSLPCNTKIVKVPSTQIWVLSRTQILRSNSDNMDAIHKFQLKFKLRILTEWRAGGATLPTERHCRRLL